MSEFSIEPTLASLIAALQVKDPEPLYRAAEAECLRVMGPAVQLRALIEFSNHCLRTCAYCGLRAANTELDRYRLTPEEILTAAREAAGLGYRTIVLQSGEDPWYTRELVTDLVCRLKEETAAALTLCLGERPRADYEAWREAGADRYLLRIETSNPDLYAQLHPGMSFAHRLQCLRDLRELGYQVGSGVLLGLPGQTLEMLAADLLFLRELEPDMIGLGPFIPHAQTPLAEAPGGTVEIALRMTALARLLMPTAHIVATTALGSLDPQGREKGLRAGANVMMPNATPSRYRPYYEIYPGKICLGEEPAECRQCIAARIESIGRTVADGFGHALRLGV